MVLHGGGPLRGDTWEFDGTTWTEVTTAVPPGTRHGHSMVYDAARGVVVLFGGADAAAVHLGDTWEFDGTGWMQITPTASPPARLRHAMVYDSARGRVVIFAGILVFPENRAEDTWEFDGATWVDVTPAVSPAARSEAQMAYDDARGVVVMYGGASEDLDPLLDTWEFDGTMWREVVTSASPGPQWWPAMTYSASLGRSVLYGDAGRTYLFDGTTWTDAAPISSPVPRRRGAPGIAYDSTRGLVVLFGGLASFPPADNYLNDTWLYGAGP